MHTTTNAGSDVKYFFVTGGVVSGLGKGLFAASLGMLLKTAGYRVLINKFDPYLNIDPGTMSPFEHGEVFVLNDGSETDLDLGHYERFLDTSLCKEASYSAGKLYWEILNNERHGKYLGKNVQIVPHVTDKIIEKYKNLKNLAENFDKNSNLNKPVIKIIELGGSVGELEIAILLEALRQFKYFNKNQIVHFHLGYIPFLECSGEYKTKPIQNSLRSLFQTGLHPDVVLARYAIKKEKNKKVDLSQEVVRKVALFSGLPKKNVIKLPDLNDIYAIAGGMLYETTLNEALVERGGVSLPSKMPEFFEEAYKDELVSSKKPAFVKTSDRLENLVSIALIGKYSSQLSDADYSLQQSLKFAARENNQKLEIKLINAEDLTQEESPEWAKLKACDAIIIPGGFGSRGLLGKIEACKYARENKIPILGICLGLQMMAVEFSRNVLKLKAYSPEMLESENISPDPLKGGDSISDIELVVNYMHGQSETLDKGASMRLGSYECILKKGSRVASFYGTEITQERHRHRLELQDAYINKWQEAGYMVYGWHNTNNIKQKLKQKNYPETTFTNESLIEIMGLGSNIHPFYYGIQSHPEFLSRPDKAHPLFVELIKSTRRA